MGQRLLELAEQVYRRAQTTRDVEVAKRILAEEERKNRVRERALRASSVSAAARPAPPQLGPPDGPDWQDGLTKLGNGELAQTTHNSRLFLRNHPDFCGQFKWNEISKTVEILGGPIKRYEFLGIEGIVAGVEDHLVGVHGLGISHPNAFRRVYAAAREHSYDPVREYLLGLEWDGVERLSSWLATYCGAASGEGPEASYVSNIGKRWMIAAAARGIRPGCKCDTMLILESDKQGIGKSTLFDILGGAWFSDTPLDVRNKDSRTMAATSWIIEMAELQSFRDADFIRMKAFLSQRTDRFRLPYARDLETFNRHCVFAGTTNQRVYLTDDTGNRRYWSVLVTRIDTDALERDRDQLFAEAVYLYLSDASCTECAAARGAGTRKRCDLHRWWLSEEEEAGAAVEAAKRVEERAWALQIQEWWADLAPGSRPKAFTVEDIATKVLEVPLDRVTEKLRQQIGVAVRDLQFRKSRLTVAGKQHWFYTPSPQQIEQPQERKVDRVAGKVLWSSAKTTVVASPN